MRPTTRVATLHEPYKTVGLPGFLGAGLLRFEQTLWARASGKHPRQPDAPWLSIALPKSFKVRSEGLRV